jgi:thiol-disulfide isomerase/thioredoxin
MKRTAITVGLFVFTAGWQFGQAPTPAAVSDPTPSRIHSLKVTVLDAATKQPVTGAEVTTYEGRDVTKATSDAAGVATLSVPVDIAYAERMQRFDVTVTDPRYAQRRVMWIATAGRVRETLPADYEIQLSSGVTAGGVAQDEHGLPLAGAKVLLSGSDYKGFSLRPGDDTKSHQEFSSVQTEEASAPMTNEQGIWRKEHFPADLNQLNIDVIRPGGARARFVTSGGFRSSRDRSTAIEMDAVKAGNVVLALKDGLTVRGIVVDEAGKPLNGVQLRARDATSRNPPYAFPNDIDGKFELPNWDATSVLVTAERAGYRTKTITIPVTADAAAGKIILAPAKPLRLRVVGENDSPVANAEVQIDPNPSDQILNWKATTDGDGRVEWDTAPDAPVNIWVAPPAPRDYPFRSVKLLADGTEHVIRLRKGEDKSIKVHLRIVDAESGAPVPNFEVWRRLPNAPFKTWGDPGEKGEFSKELTPAELPNGYVPSYRLQVRAAGYTGWSSEALDYSNGDQDLMLKLTKGESTLTNEPPPARQPGQGISDKTNPSLLILAASAARLLETSDVAAFVQATNASLDDWNSIIPKGVDPKEGPLGANPTRIIARREKTIAASATHVLELAQRVGAAQGKMRFVVKSVSSPMDASTGYTIGGQSVMLPYAMALRIVLTGEPVGDAGGKPLRGDYELSIGNAHQMPAGWRSEEGVRWTAFPPGLADEATQRELRLANMAAPDTFSRQQTLSGADDQTLLMFGGVVTDLVRARAVPAFLTAATFSRDEIVDFYQRFGWGSEKSADESRDRVTTGLTTAAQAMLDLLNRIGVDFSDAKLTVKQVLAERPSFTRFGQLEGLRGGPVRVTFAVESSRIAKSGRPIGGNYIVTIGDAVRANNRWVMIDDKIRWQEFPKGLVADDELKHVEFENYVAENRTLPPGYAVPEIEFVRLSDGTRTSLSAYRGKVVVLEFWATWCGPCQEPMEKLQHLRESHPDWKDRVEVIALSIDDKAEEAREHLTKKGWSQTTNVWAGDGGWSSGPAKEFRVRGVPTAYVIDGDGKVVKAGHPMSLDFGTIVDAQLRQVPR